VEKMKKAVFDLTTIVNPWKPPFGKKIEADEIEVAEGQGFDSMERVHGNVFKLVKCDGDSCLVHFSEKFTLKGHEHPRNRKVEVGKKPVSFTYLWGNDGVTKKLALKRVSKF